MDTKFPRDNAVTDGGYFVQVSLIDAVCAIKEHIAKCKNNILIIFQTHFDKKLYINNLINN
jgi:hypothetical protein